MNGKLAMAAILAGVLLIPALAWAEDTGLEERLPQGTGFHIDLFGLGSFNGAIETLEREDKPHDRATTTRANTGTATGMGARLGALIDGHHDVGGYISFDNRAQQVAIDPDDERREKTEISTGVNTVRIAPYYNYNFHASNWVMPYVGGMIGVDLISEISENHKVDDSKVETATVTPFGGIEGGVKLFPMPRVAFDLGLSVTAGPTYKTTTYEEEGRDDVRWTGATIGFTPHAGLNVYF